MSRIFLSFFALALALGFVIAQDEIRRGIVKAIDAEKGTITLAVNGKDETFFLVADADVRTNGKRVEKPLEDKGLKVGSQVQFKSATKDGKSLLTAMRYGEQPKGQPLPKVDTSKLKPLPELGTEKYQGYEGGFYPGGKNERPKEHNDTGLALAKAMQPLDADGKPNANGKIVMLSVGMSNATQVFSTFKRIADADKEKNPSLVLVDGAQGGMTAVRIKDPDDKGSGTQYWSVVDQRLKTAGITLEQVQIAWIKQADAGPTQGFPKYAQTLRDELRQIVIAMKVRFPNLKMVYLSSRTYGGYATTALNPEPYAFESGFSVKWLIEEQLKGDKELNFDPKKGAVKAPWLSWGPYLWANGTTKNSEGLSYEESDYGSDGTHPSQAGQRKVAEHMLKFFKSDPTTKPWFVKKE
jgi:hypothetical protein